MPTIYHRFGFHRSEPYRLVGGGQVVTSAGKGEWAVEFGRLVVRQQVPLGAAGAMVSVAIDVPPGAEVSTWWATLQH